VRFVVLPFLIFSFGLSACTGKAKTSSVVNSSDSKISLNKAELLSELSAPGTTISVKAAALDSSFTEVSTDHEQKFYLKNDRVVSSSRLPTGDETALIYWRYRFERNETRDSLPASTVQSRVPASHPLSIMPNSYQLSCDHLGTGVVYDPLREKVERVFFYEAH
jgi:hypothetical protein